MRDDRHSNAASTLPTVGVALRVVTVGGDVMTAIRPSYIVNSTGPDLGYHAFDPENPRHPDGSLRYGEPLRVERWVYL